MKKIIFSLLMISVIAQAFGADNDSKIFKKKYIKKTMLTAASWQLEHPKHELDNWTNGAFYTGVFAAYETTKSKKIYKALLDMGNRNEWEPANACITRLCDLSELHRFVPPGEG